jgi:hypothetical protein
MASGTRWRQAKPPGDKTLASAFQVKAGQVARFARYDDLPSALEAAGLDESDERKMAP